MNQTKFDYNNKKQERRIKKRTTKRNATAEEVIFIFEKVLDSWKTIKIYNTIIQENPSSQINKKWVESIATGNCKLFENELDKEKYMYYLELRENVYAFNNDKKQRL